MSKRPNVEIFTDFFSNLTLPLENDVFSKALKKLRQWRGYYGTTKTTEVQVP